MWEVNICLCLAFHGEKYVSDFQLKVSGLRCLFLTDFLRLRYNTWIMEYHRKFQQMPISYQYTEQ